MCDLWVGSEGAGLGGGTGVGGFRGAGLWRLALGGDLEGGSLRVLPLATSVEGHFWVHSSSAHPGPLVCLSITARGSSFGAQYCPQ